MNPVVAEQMRSCVVNPFYATFYDRSQPPRNGEFLEKAHNNLYGICIWKIEPEIRWNFRSIPRIRVDFSGVGTQLTIGWYGF